MTIRVLALATVELQHVLTFLKSFELIGVCRVSRVWYAAVSSPLVWRLALSLTRTKASTNASYFDASCIADLLKCAPVRTAAIASCRASFSSQHKNFGSAADREFEVRTACAPPHG
jgi:hypothetical protein